MKPMNVNKLSADERISRACIRLLRTEPFYAAVLLGLDRVSVADKPKYTMAVDGVHLFYSAAFVDTLKDAELEIVLEHEVDHITLKHNLRENGYAERELFSDEPLADSLPGCHSVVRRLFNEAADLAINSELIKKAGFPEHTGIVPGRGAHAGFESGLNAETYYERLLDEEKRKRREEQQQQPKPEPQQGSSSGEKPEPGAGEPGGDGEGNSEPEKENGDSGEDARGEGEGESQPDTTPDGENPQGGQNSTGGGQNSGEGEPEPGAGDCPELPGDMGQVLPHPADDGTEAGRIEAEKDWQRLIVPAAMAAKEAGKLPGYLQSRIEAELKPPEVPWQVKLRRYCSRLVRGGVSWSRLNRRTAWREDVARPSRRKPGLRKALMIVDVSGSMSEAAVNSAISEACNILKAYPSSELTILQCDTRVTDERTVRPHMGTSFERLARSGDYSRSGHGGTELSPAFQRVPALRPDVVICVTDAYLQWPGKVNVPTVWLITDRNDEVSAPWGETIHIKTDKKEG